MSTLSLSSRFITPPPADPLTEPPPLPRRSRTGIMRPRGKLPPLKLLPKLNKASQDRELTEPQLLFLEDLVDLNVDFLVYLGNNMTQELCREIWPQYNRVIKHKSCGHSSTSTSGEDEDTSEVKYYTHHLWNKWKDVGKNSIIFWQILDRNNKKRLVRWWFANKNTESRRIVRRLPFFCDLTSSPNSDN